jgi:hypothetical protein
MLNQLPRDSWHVIRLPCEDVPIFLEEFDAREFLFRIQVITHVSNLGRFLRGQGDHFVECVLRLDRRLGGLGLGHYRVWGGLRQGLLQFLELYRRRESVSCLATLLVRVIGALDVSPDGDDTVRS